MQSPGGSWYSPRLLLSLIFELSPDSRFVAAHRSDPAESNEWPIWGSRTFQNQLLANISNTEQMHMLGNLNWEKGRRPEYQPLLDPSAAPIKKKGPPSVEDIHNMFLTA